MYETAQIPIDCSERASRPSDKSNDCPGVHRHRVYVSVSRGGGGVIFERHNTPRQCLCLSPVLFSRFSRGIFAVFSVRNVNCLIKLLTVVVLVSVVNRTRKSPRRPKPGPYTEGAWAQPRNFERRCNVTKTNLINFVYDCTTTVYFKYSYISRVSHRSLHVILHFRKRQTYTYGIEIFQILSDDGLNRFTTTVVRQC